MFNLKQQQLITTCIMGEPDASSTTKELLKAYNTIISKGTSYSFRQYIYEKAEMPVDKPDLMAFIFATVVYRHGFLKELSYKLRRTVTDDEKKEFIKFINNLGISFDLKDSAFDENYDHVMNIENSPD
jgi:hypothetical protein